MPEETRRAGQPGLSVRRWGQINFSAILATVLGSAILAVAGFVYSRLEQAQETSHKVVDLDKRLGRIEDVLERIEEKMAKKK